MGEIWDFGRAPHGARGIFYDPPGAGAKRHSVHNALSRVLSVEDFGAVGDGTTDDRAAIQSAVDAVESLGGGLVLFHGKTYAIGSVHPTFVSVSGSSIGIIARPGVYLRGAGRGATTIKRTVNTEMHMVNFAGAIVGAGISGITLDGDYPTLTTVGHGIHTENGEFGVISDLDILDMEIKNVGSFGIGLEFGSLQRITIRNIYSDHTGADCIDIKNQSGNNSGIVIDGVFSNEHAIRSNLVNQAAINIRGEATLTNIFCTYTSVGNVDKEGIRIRSTGGTPSSLGGRRSSLTNFVISATGQTSGTALSINHDSCHASNGWIGGAFNGVLVNGASCAVVNVSVEGILEDGFRATVNGVNAVFTACHSDSSGRFGFLLEGAGQQIIGGSSKTSTTAGVRVASAATDALILGVNLTGETTPVGDLGTDTVGMLCAGWLGTGEITMGGHALIGDMSTYDAPLSGRPFLHIGENIVGSTTPNGEMVLGHADSLVTGDILGQLSFYSSDASFGTSTGRQAAIRAVSEHAAGASAGLAFATGLGSDDGGIEYMRISATGQVGIGEAAPDYKLDVNGAIGFTPGTSVTPVDNGDVVFELTNNTTLTIKAKGTDGVVRSGTVTLA